MTPGLVNNLRTTNYEQRITSEALGAKGSGDFIIRKKAKFEKEFWKLIKFGIVGASTFLLQLFLYIILSRFLLSDIPRTLIYALAMGYAMAENYTAHRLWTFNDQNTPHRSALRYSIVVAMAASANAFIFWLGHHIIQIHDIIVVCFAGLIIPLITYAGHRWYTFKRP